MKGICKAQFWPIIELAEVFLISNNYRKAEDNLERDIFSFSSIKRAYNVWVCGH